MLENGMLRWYDATLTYLNKEAINESVHKTAVFISQECDMLIKVDYEGKYFEYLLEFQTKDDKRIGIRLFSYSFELKVQNIKNLNNEPIIIDLPNPYVIVLEENKNTLSTYEIIIRIPSGEQLKYKSRVLKYWEYDLDSLYKTICIYCFHSRSLKLEKRLLK